MAVGPVEKGRQIAGIILDSWARGRRKHVWFRSACRDGDVCSRPCERTVEVYLTLDHNPNPIPRPPGNFLWEISWGEEVLKSLFGLSTIVSVEAGPNGNLTGDGTYGVFAGKASHSQHYNHSPELSRSPGPASL